MFPITITLSLWEPSCLAPAPTRLGTGNTHPHTHTPTHPHTHTPTHPHTSSCPFHRLPTNTTAPFVRWPPPPMVAGAAPWPARAFASSGLCDCGGPGLSSDRCCSRAGTAVIESTKTFAEAGYALRWRHALTGRLHTGYFSGTVFYRLAQIDRRVENPCAPACGWLWLVDATRCDGCGWMRLAGCCWLLLAAAGCCWLLLAAAGCC